MEARNVNTIFTEKYNWIWRAVYWTTAALLMFFIFSNRSYDLQIRFALVGLLIVCSYFISYAVNQYLIPNLLFQGKIFLFVYALFALLILTLWVIFLAIFFILLYSSINLPDVVIPQREDIIILVSGNYLIVTMAAVIHFIRESYKRYIEKNNLERQKQETEVKLKEAHLRLLQGQIHPHFLFNMLNNLYVLVKENTKYSQQVILRLSSLLDYMLYECNQEEVALQKEIQFIQNYIQLERIRHDEDFNVNTNFPEDTGDLKIAPLILFPFVENAFKHGFQNAQGNYVKIDLEHSTNHLVFKVENRTSKETADKYLNQEGKGIGLRNIRERLAHLYPNEYKLQILPEKEIFKIRLEIKSN